MYYQDIISSLSSNKKEKLFFGEYIIEKKLREVVGGIPIYDIEVTNLNDGTSERFETLHDLDVHCLNNMESHGLKRCINCGTVTNQDYYYHNEDDVTLCDIGCLTNYMNSNYGIGNWYFASMLLDNPDLTKGLLLVKATDTDNVDVVLNGISWRYCDVQIIHNHFPEDSDLNDETMEDIFADQDFGI